MAINFQFPTFSEDMLDTEKGRKQLFEALYQLTRQLKWVLSNLGEENFSEEYKENNDITAVNESIRRLDANVRSVSGKASNSVPQNAVIKAINDSSETDKIETNRLDKIAGGNLDTTEYSGSGDVRFLGLDSNGNIVEFSCKVYDSTTSAVSEQYAISAVAPE